MSATHPDRGHLDAETLAAWFDGGLDAASVAAAEAHVSSCDHCQAMVATVIRTIPLTPGTKAPGTFALWRWWLAPIAAATAAVVIWAVVPQRVIAPTPPPTTVATPDVAPAPQVAGTRENAQSPVPETPPQRLEREQQFADASRRDASNEVRAQRKESDPKTADTPQFAPVPSPAAAPPPAPAAPPVAAVAETATVRQEKALDRAAEIGAAAAPTAQLRARQVAAVEIATPDPSRRWRMADQAIERSDDGGRTWRQVRPAQGDTIAAGSAPTPTVAWFVGANGLVLVTTDGTVFTRTASPTSADLIAVTATDARTATVTAADGRTFRTDDGGRSWR